VSSGCCRPGATTRVSTTILEGALLLKRGSLAIARSSMLKRALGALEDPLGAAKCMSQRMAEAEETEGTSVLHRAIEGITPQP